MLSQTIQHLNIKRLVSVTKQNNSLVHSLANWSPQVGEQEMAQDMRTAFDEWAKYGNLKFVRVFTPDADIIVGFGSHYHGDKLS